MATEDTGADPLTEGDREILEAAARKLSDDLQKATEGGSREHIEVIEEQIEKFRNHCLNAYGMKTRIQDGRLRLSTHQLKRLSPAREKDRQNVKNQIENALSIIKNAGLLKLHEHLKKYINGGEKYSYNPAPEDRTSWQIEGI